MFNIKFLFMDYLRDQNNKLYHSYNLRKEGFLDSSNRICNNYGLYTGYNVGSGGVVRDGYYNVVGTVQQTPVFKPLMKHP
jgi:hypothetical protein